MTSRAPRLNGTKLASRAGKILSNPRSTKTQKRAAATVLSRRSSGKLTKSDSLLRIIGLGKSKVSGGLSKTKH